MTRSDTTIHGVCNSSGKLAAHDGARFKEVLKGVDMVGASREEKVVKLTRASALQGIRRRVP
jgi:hypothetical protein